VVPYRSVPQALLAVLTVLTVAFALLAVFTSPSLADLAVRNGAAETFSTHQFTMRITLNESTGQGASRSEVQVIDYTAPDQLLVTQANQRLHYAGARHRAEIDKALQEYIGVTGGPVKWHHDGSGFSRTEQLGEFVSRQGNKPSAQGTVQERAVVQGGYLTSVALHVTTKAETESNGETLEGVQELETLQLLKIDGAAIHTAS
jgi:hypothetical protein